MNEKASTKHWGLPTASDENLNWLDNFGPVIKEERLRRGWSQPQLAEKVGVTRSSICLYEKSERLNSLKTLLAIAEAFGMKLSKLVKKAERYKEKAAP
jgi:transcriptional regulator with XRE-family HTH domain